MGTDANRLEGEPGPTPSDLDAAFRFYGRVTADLITIFDADGCIRFANEAAERVLGCSPKQCTGESLFAFIHDDDREEAHHAFQRWSRANGDNLLLIETRVLARVGELRHLHWTVAPYRTGPGAPHCYISHARDVTPLMRASERFRRSEVRHRAVFTNVLDPMITIDAHGKIVEASRSVEAVFGYRSEELVGANVKLLMVEPYVSEHDSYLDNYRRTGETGILGRTRQFDVRRKDGGVISCELSVARVDVPEEKEPLFVGSFRDVSARRRAELALAESEARMRAIFDQEYEFVGLLDCAGTLLEINRSALKGVGAERHQVVGRPFWETPWWSATSAEQLRDAVSRAAAGEFVRFEVEFVDKGGEQRWVDFSLKPVRDEGGVVHFLLPEGRDISSFKATHARELAMQAAMAEIGESASLLAHEIKNPITAVNLALRAVADRLGEDQRRVLEDLTSRLTKLERTMRRTLSFAKPLKLEREPCRLAHLLRGVAGLVEAELKTKGIALEVECADESLTISADRGLFEEVLLNLVGNAREALERGGRIRLTAARDGRMHVRILVEDDGPGIPPSVRGGLFKPFVTSKSGGTGLGLAITRKIVNEHGGEIGLRDPAEGGTGFWIRLPAVRGRSGHVRMGKPASA